MAIKCQMVLTLILLLYVIVEGNLAIEATEKTKTSNLSILSWLNKHEDPRAPGCWKRPWICKQGDSYPNIKRRCCKNRCADILSDVNNCGLCGIRCPFTWQCCKGLCINTNRNPFNCGRCGRKCPKWSMCVYGMCGYANPPFPFPPRPWPPPQPPFPFPPKPPKREPSPTHPKPPDKPQIPDQPYTSPSPPPPRQTIYHLNI